LQRALGELNDIVIHETLAPRSFVTRTAWQAAKRLALLLL
jgi:hypothetical protein